MFGSVLVLKLKAVHTFMMAVDVLINPEPDSCGTNQKNLSRPTLTELGRICKDG